jgi:hypothetical protein
LVSVGSSAKMEAVRSGYEVRYVKDAEKYYEWETLTWAGQVDPELGHKLAKGYYQGMAEMSLMGAPGKGLAFKALGSRALSGSRLAYRFAKIRPGIGQWNQFQTAMGMSSKEAARYYKSYQQFLSRATEAGVKASAYGGVGEQASEFGYNALGGQGPTYTPGGAAGSVVYELFGGDE